MYLGDQVIDKPPRSVSLLRATSSCKALRMSLACCMLFASVLATAKPSSVSADTASSRYFFIIVLCSACSSEVDAFGLGTTCENTVHSPALVPATSASVAKLISDVPATKVLLA